MKLCKLILSNGKKISQSQYMKLIDQFDEIEYVELTNNFDIVKLRTSLAEQSFEDSLIGIDTTFVSNINLNQR
jgi:hypothetical protein